MRRKSSAVDCAPLANIFSRCGAVPDGGAVWAGWAAVLPGGDGECGGAETAVSQLRWAAGIWYGGAGVCGAV